MYFQKSLEVIHVQQGFEVCLCWCVCLCMCMYILVFVCVYVCVHVSVYVRGNRV